MCRVLLVDDIEVFRKELTLIIDRMQDCVDRMAASGQEQEYTELNNLIRRLSDEICAGITVNLYNAAEVEQYTNELITYSDTAAKTGETLLSKTINDTRIDESARKYAVSMILNKIRERILSKLTWLDKYYDMNDLFTLRDKETAREYSERLKNHIFELHFSCQSELIQSVCEYVLNHIDDGISLEIVATKMYVNKTYLSHIFKVETGSTFVDYVTRVKMQRAKLLLISTDVKVNELAHMLGFEDAEYFGKLFKKYNGMSATAYSKRA